MLGYAESNRAFRKKLLHTYHALPYVVQARAEMLSPRFFQDLKRLKSKGPSDKEVAEKLGVSSKTVVKPFKEMKG